MSFYEQGMQYFMRDRITDAYKAYSDGVEAGEVKCAYGLAHLLKHSRIVGKDEARATKLIADNMEKLKALLDSGDTEAMLIYGAYNKDRQLIIKAAELGNANAQYYCFLHFCDTEDEEMEWLKRAANQGHGKAQKSYAARLLDKGKIEEGIAWLNKAADQGFFRAMFALGHIYRWGKYGEQDYKKAFDYYMKAARLGSAIDQYYVGQCYRKGEGVEQSAEKAAEWYIKAAEQNCRPALIALGECYYDGVGTARDLHKAKEYYERAQELGYDCKTVLKKINAELKKQ